MMLNPMMRPIASPIPFPPCEVVNNGAAANIYTVKDGLKTITDYGTVDLSTLLGGYFCISFTAVGDERVFVLQGPKGTQTNFIVDKDETIKALLIDGIGEYQYVIGHSTADKFGYYVDYQNSFTYTILG